MVTSIQEVNVKQAYIFGRGIANVRSKYTLGARMEVGFDDWQDAIDPYADPNLSELSNAQFIDWENERLAQVDSENAWQTARQSIRSMAETAVEFTEEIAICFAAIKNAQFPPTANDSATFTAMISALNDAAIGNGFRNVVRDAFAAQSGLTINFADVSGVTASQQQRFNAFCDYFFTSWALMVFLGRTQF